MYYASLSLDFLAYNLFMNPKPGARIGVVALACNLSSLEAEAERQPKQQFQAGMSYTARPCLKKQKQTDKRQIKTVMTNWVLFLVGRKWFQVTRLETRLEWLISVDFPKTHENHLHIRAGTHRRQFKMVALGPNSKEPQK